ncbi:MAG TPA: sigma-70 family RNA polymerase sigma factor [Acidimicrobiales bacterium]|nr:sigma-70 family RNA polymerase sigma factor [Acidimicrobiales bacterium]
MAMTTTLEAHGDQFPDGPSDAVLLERVRAGDKDAYGQLYLRHEPAATSLARYLTKSNHEADDVVADAFARVLRAIKGGAGPTEAFRPYLLTAVRRTVWRHAEESNHHRLAASEDEAELLDLRLAVEPEDKTDEGIILRAFQELPERWQLVLWHTEIEGQPPAAVAPLLGLSPNATAALAVRAREGLRQAFLQAHLQAQPAESCRFSVEHLGSFVRDGLGKRDNAKVEAHLAQCEDCRGLQADLGSLNKALRGVVGPAVLGAGAARWLQTRAAEASAGSGAVEHARSVAHRLRFPQAVALAGVAAALVATLGLNSDLARPPADTGNAVATAEVGPLETDAGTGQVVPPELAGTPAGESPGLQAAPCDGAAMPLSLPEGSTPTGAALVEAPDAGTAPTVVDPDQAAGLSTVDSGNAALVGRQSACVGNMIQPLDGAPPDTALAVSFLDRLGNLQILVVPQIVDVVQDAVHAATDLADAANARLQAYLQALAAQADQLTGGSGGGSTGGIGPIDPGDVPVDVPDLPALPPATDGGGGAVDDTVDDVGGIVDGVVGGVNDTVNGLLG